MAKTPEAQALDKIAKVGVDLARECTRTRKALERLVDLYGTELYQNNDEENTND